MTKFGTRYSTSTLTYIHAHVHQRSRSSAFPFIHFSITANHFPQQYRQNHRPTCLQFRGDLYGPSSKVAFTNLGVFSDKNSSYHLPRSENLITDRKRPYHFKKDCRPRQPSRKQGQQNPGSLLVRLANQLNGLRVQLLRLTMNWPRTRNILTRPLRRGTLSQPTTLGWACKDLHRLPFPSHSIQVRLSAEKQIHKSEPIEAMPQKTGETMPCDIITMGDPQNS